MENRTLIENISGLAIGLTIICCCGICAITLIIYCCRKPRRRPIQAPIYETNTSQNREIKISINNTNNNIPESKPIEIGALLNKSIPEMNKYDTQLETINNNNIIMPEQKLSDIGVLLNKNMSEMNKYDS